MSGGDPKNPYYYPGTEVYRNLANIRDAVELDRFEGQRVAHNLVGLKARPIEGEFNAKRLRETHRRVFEGVYEWAGQYREGTGAIHKQRQGFDHVVGYGNSAFIPAEVDRQLKKLKAENYLKGLDPDTFAKRLAHYYGELDATHSFPDGNSRSLRQFTQDLAKHAGYKLDWSKSAESEASRKRLYLARDIAVMNNDSAQLAAIIKEGLTPLQTRTARLSQIQRYAVAVQKLEQERQAVDFDPRHAPALQPSERALLATTADAAKTPIERQVARHVAAALGTIEGAAGRNTFTDAELAKTYDRYQANSPTRAPRDDRGAEPER